MATSCVLPLPAKLAWFQAVLPPAVLPQFAVPVVLFQTNVLTAIDQLPCRAAIAQLAPARCERCFGLCGAVHRSGHLSVRGKAPARKTQNSRIGRIRSQRVITWLGRRPSAAQ